MWLSIMDPEKFLDLANQVTKLKMYPYFDFAHSVMCLLMIREELSTGAVEFSRRHPFSCWMSSMAVIFSGSLLANLMMGEPMLSPFKNNNALLVATLAWYVVFYLPFDVGFTVFKSMPMRVVCAGLKEVYRAKKVHDGVSHAAKMFPNAYLIMIFIGAVKGSGESFIRVGERLIRGVWTPEAIEFLRPSVDTKACLVASLIFVLDKKTDLISAPHALVYFGIVIFFVYFKMSAILLGLGDPFMPFENIISAVFLGGIMDSILNTFYGRKSEDGDEKKD